MPEHIAMVQRLWASHPGQPALTPTRQDDAVLIGPDAELLGGKANVFHHPCVIVGVNALQHHTGIVQGVLRGRLIDIADAFGAVLERAAPIGMQHVLVQHAWYVLRQIV